MNLKCFRTSDFAHPSLFRFFVVFGVVLAEVSFHISRDIEGELTQSYDKKNPLYQRITDEGSFPKCEYDQYCQFYPI